MLAGVSARVVVNESVYVRVCACGCVRAREMIPVSRSFIQTKKRKWNFKGFLVFCHVLGFFWVDWRPSVDILVDGFESRRCEKESLICFFGKSCHVLIFLRTKGSKEIRAAAAKL